MKAEELRVGNLVEYNGMQWVVLSIIYPSPRNDKYSGKWLLELSNGGIITVPLEECMPIPLTEEWLEKTNLEKFMWGHKINGILYLRNNEEGWYLTVLDERSEERWCSDNVLQYVHQFQNVYYGLKHEEITEKQ